MKQRLSTFFLFICLCLPLFAAVDPFIDTVTARPIALGGAYVGLANDASGIFYNPAGLAKIKQPNLISLYTQPVTDVTLTVLGGAIPNQWGGTVGGGFRQRITANITPSTGEVFDYTEQDFTLLYSRKLKEDLSVGGDLRFIARGINRNIASYEGLNGNGMMLDLGVKYKPFPWLESGLVLRNLGGRITYQSGAKSELSLNTIIGASLKLLGTESYLQEKKWGELLLNVDFNKIAQEPLAQGHLGLEWNPQSLISLRFGMDQTPNSASANYTHLAYGFGLKYRGITFDYTYKKWNDALENVAHYFSIGYVGYEPPLLLTPEALAEPIKFSDVPDDYWAHRSIEQLTMLGLMDYYPDKTFRPERPITRADLVRLLTKLKNYPLPAEKRQHFKDVASDFWAADEIQAAWENKLALGYPDGTFRPRDSTTRAEGVTFLARFDGLRLKPAGQEPFTDLPTRHWAIKEVLAAKEEGWLGFMLGRPFQPGLQITRAELAEILYQTVVVKDKLSKAKL